MDQLENEGTKFIEWKEPDINNEVTAIASIGSSKIFKKLNLL